MEKIAENVTFHGYSWLIHKDDAFFLMPGIFLFNPYITGLFFKAKISQNDLEVFFGSLLNFLGFGEI